MWRVYVHEGVGQCGGYMYMRVWVNVEGICTCRED